MSRKFLLTFLLSHSFHGIIFSQTDDIATEVFKATHAINSNTTANLTDGMLDFRIQHRFGSINEGPQNYYGIDDALTKISFDYGIAKWLMIGVGHSTLNKEDDGTIKISFLKQRQRSMPLSLNYFGAISIETAPAPVLPAGDQWLVRYRLYYVNQLLIARKFGERVSLQLMPTIIHYNIVDNSKYSNNMAALGVAARIRVTRRFALLGEYYYRINNVDMPYSGLKTYNPLSLGFEVESGGHVFQLMLTNTQGLTEHAFIGQTTDSWDKGGLHIGFNISRVFAIVKSKEFHR